MCLIDRSWFAFAALLAASLAAANVGHATLAPGRAWVELEFCNDGTTGKFPKRHEMMLCQVAPPSPGPQACTAELGWNQFILYRDLPPGGDIKVAANLYDGLGRRLKRTSASGSLNDGRVSIRLEPLRAHRAGDWIGIEFRLPRKVRKLRRGECLKVRVNSWVAR